jgi:hypothetical protein
VSEPLLANTKRRSVRTFVDAEQVPHDIVPTGNDVRPATAVAFHDATLRAEIDALSAAVTVLRTHAKLRDSE